jgi:outer membrane protein W
MKKIFSFIFVFGLAALMTFSGTLRAADSRSQSGKRLAIGVHAGYASMSEDQFGGAPAFGLNLTYNFSKNLRFEIRGSFISSDTENSVDGFGEGTLKVKPVQASIQYLFNAGKKFVPYLGAGAGYYLNDLSIEGNSQWQQLGFIINEEADGAFGFHFGGGMDYFFNPNMAFNLDVRYCIVSVDGTYSITEEVSGLSYSGELSADMNPIILSAGIKVLF